MTGFIRRHIGWLIGLTIAVAVIVCLLVLLNIRQNNDAAALATGEKQRNELALQIEKQENDIKDLNNAVETLRKENDSLQEKLVYADILSQHDAVIFDRSLPLDLVKTLLTYYKAKDDKDLKAYKSVIAPAGHEQHQIMLDAFTYSPGIDAFGKVKDIFLIAYNTTNSKALDDASFEGGIALTVDLEFYGEILYLSRDNGKWFVTYWD